MWLAQEPAVPASRAFRDNEASIEFQENDKTGRLSLLDHGPVVLQHYY
jgi:hypothetical protein